MVDDDQVLHEPRRDRRSGASRIVVIDNKSSDRRSLFGVAAIFEVPITTTGFGRAHAIEQFLHGEFDPGSGQTLAACLTHASRARKGPSGPEYSGERVSNTWATCLKDWDNSGKPGLIPGDVVWRKAGRPNGSFGLRLEMGPRPISLLVR